MLIVLLIASIVSVSLIIWGMTVKEDNPQLN